MAQTDYDRFFWTDWLGDQELRACSALARSVWMDMICLGGINQERRGYIEISGRPVLPADLSRICNLPVETIQTCLSELESNHVFSRDRNNAIFCRRQVRQVKRTEASAKGGRTGGRSARDRKAGIFSEKTENFVPVSPSPTTEIPSTPGVAPDSSHKSLVTSHKSLPPNPQGGRALKESDERRFATISKLLNISSNDHHRWVRFIRQSQRLESQGIDIDKDLIPCMEAMKAEGRLPTDVDSLTYFEKPALAYRQALEIAAAVERRLAEERAGATASKLATITTAGWEEALWWWMFDGSWDLGPKPGEEGCRAPHRHLGVTIRTSATLLGGRPYARYEPAANGHVPPDWPAGKFRTDTLRLEDLKNYIATGVDVRYPDREQVDNVVPIRKAM